MNSTYHVAVMLSEAIDGLQIEPSGTYVDATFGAGGHSAAILEKLSPKGRLITFDKDDDALPNIPDDKRLTLVNHDFVHMRRFLDVMHVKEVDGILADLGLSSFQVDTAERGFSFRYDAPLDMRMDKQGKVTASDIINGYPAGKLQELFSTYGEVRNAKTLAAAIVEKRKSKRIETTGELADIASSIIPKSENLRKYLAPVFQALRIIVNDELNGLKKFLTDCIRVLKKGARLVVITYHSLEDRIVKTFFQNGTFEKKLIEKDVFGNVAGKGWNVITVRPIVPSLIEIEQNPRARSAKMRIAEKL